RGEKVGMGGKSPDSQARREFKALEYFPASERYRVTARLVPYDPPKSLSVPTVLGTVESMPSPGSLQFTIEGRELSLDPVLESPDAPELFIIFKDPTNGKETYPPGRFLYTDLSN